MDFTPLIEFLDYYIPALGIPGSDTSIYVDHEEVFRHTAGFNDADRSIPMQDDLLYNVYSCTKVVTAVAMCQLIERGEILPTDPVYAYLPEFKELKIEAKDSEGRVIGYKRAESTMLVGHLLTMSSGIKYDLNSPSILEVKDRTEGRAPTLDICRAIAREPLSFDPGHGYEYGLSYDILGGIIELISGVSLSEYIRDNILLPLDMLDTAFHPDHSARDRFAAHYDYDNVTHSVREKPFEKNDFRFGCEYDSGGAGLIGSVKDFALFADALANDGIGKNGRRIVSSRALALMRHNFLDPALSTAFSSPINAGYGYGYGVRTNIDPFPYGNLAPVGEFGWDGAKGCLLSVDPSGRVALFHAEHSGGVNSLVLPRLRNIVYSCL